MELGLVTESCLRNVSFVTRSPDSGWPYTTVRHDSAWPDVKAEGRRTRRRRKSSRLTRLKRGGRPARNSPQDLVKPVSNVGCRPRSSRFKDERGGKVVARANSRRRLSRRADLNDRIASRIIESLKLNAPGILGSCARQEAPGARNRVLLEIDRDKVRSVALDDCLGRMRIDVTLNVVGNYLSPDTSSIKTSNRPQEVQDEARLEEDRNGPSKDCPGAVAKGELDLDEEQQQEQPLSKRVTENKEHCNQGTGKGHRMTSKRGKARSKVVPARPKRKRSPGPAVSGARPERRKADGVGIDSRRLDDDAQEGRRVTRGLTRVSKENFVGKLVWGFCSGWWPALIVEADHVGMQSEPGRLWVYWIGEARISLLNERTQIERFSWNLESRLTQASNAARARAIHATIQMIRKRFDFTLTKPYHAWIGNNFAAPNPSIDEVKFYPYPGNVQRRLDQLKERNARATEKYLLEQKQSNQPRRLPERAREPTQQTTEDNLTRLPLREQSPGVIAWAKIAGHNWWPAMIIDYRDCCMREPGFGCQWIMWYGDYQMSQVHHNSFMRFEKGFERMREYVQRTKRHVYLVGVLQAAKDYCTRLGAETDNWDLEDVLGYFANRDVAGVPEAKPRDSARIYDKYTEDIVEKLHRLNDNPDIDGQRRAEIGDSGDLRAVREGRARIEELCLRCLKVFDNPDLDSHPFLVGSLCKQCSEQFKPRMFLFGNDGKCFYCTICGGTGTVVICDNEDCPRVYCTACLKYLLCPGGYEEMLLEDPWQCFLCRKDSPFYKDLLVKPRTDWKERIIDTFRTGTGPKPGEEEPEAGWRKRKIRVLSLFDGLSTGLLVLLKLGLDVDVYYASEIDPDALMVSNCHYGDRVIHLGDVRSIDEETIRSISPIDLLIGGSPCNDLSLANPARLGLHDPRGTGVLFFDYCRVKELVIEANKGHRLFWFYENVASMPSEYRLEINKHLGQEPDVIDSADFSPQHRLRLYWHNLPMEPRSLCVQGRQDVQDILTPHCQRYALVKKIRTVTTRVNSLKQGKLALKPILMRDTSDSIWITELEEIFGFPRHYTDVKNLSATKRQRLIGKSWSVQTLTEILRCLCPFFQCDQSVRFGGNLAKT